MTRFTAPTHQESNETGLTSGQVHVREESILSENSSVIYVSTDVAVNTFKPLTLTSQLSLCRMLGIHTSRPVESVFSSIQEPLTSRPDYIKTIVGDGNCFYRAVSYCPTKSEAYHMDIRLKLFSYMKQIHHMLSSVVMTGETVEQYLKSANIQKRGTWASQTEIIALSHFLKTDIWIYTGVGGTWKWANYSGRIIQNTLRPLTDSIYLYHRNTNHFEVVLGIHVPADRPNLLTEYFKAQSEKAKEKQLHG